MSNQEFHEHLSTDNGCFSHNYKCNIKKIYSYILRYLEEWKTEQVNKIATATSKEEKQALQKMAPNDRQVERTNNIVYALELFTTLILSEHPEKIILPSQLTQSKLELLFSNIKLGSTRELSEGTFASQLAGLRASSLSHLNPTFNDFAFLHRTEEG